ncbi:MAG: type II toxin-antitoxin system VapC family toxin [Kutzneria sp.]|nr:type II toxin-antitoxin system VapC family toxin [Kutzneria sp.]
MVTQRALADTSLFIGLEQRHFLPEKMPSDLAVSTVTIGELKVGVLAAEDAPSRAARLRTLGDALALSPLAVDEAVADAWAELRIRLREIGRPKLPVNDSWIAATAIAHGLPVVTQDDDYDGTPGLEVIKL